MKRKLDLRTGRPVWMAYRAPKPHSSPLKRDIKTDVLIVGAGISGAMIAEMLTDQGQKVVLIDRRGPMMGSTPATTALVQNEIDTPLLHLTKMIGKGDAQAAWRRSRLALASLKARVQELQIRCDLAERPSLLLAGDVLDARGLEEEIEVRRECGIYADFLTRSQLKDKFNLSRTAAILNPDNIALDPRKLTAGLLNASIARGAVIYAPLEAVTFEDGVNGVLVGTRQGPTIHSAKVVLATGYELASIAPSKGHSIISTWAMATRPQRQNLWPREAFIWEASDPYLYLRATPDGRVICGGEDEVFEDEEKRDALLPEKIGRIAKKLSKLVPRLDTTPEFAWAGSFGTTPTGLPIIGKIPRRSNIWSIMGYGGNGITYSRIAAELVTSAILGKKDCDAALFAPPPA